MNGPKRTFQDKQRTLQEKPTKADLLKKMKKQTKSKTKITIQQEETQTDYKALYKKMKSKVDRLEKQQRQGKSNEPHYSKNEKLLQKELDKKKKELFETKEQLTKERKQVQLFKQTINDMKKKQKETERDYVFLQESHRKAVHHFDKVKEQVTYYRSRNQLLEDKHKHMLQLIQEKNEKVEFYHKKSDTLETKRNRLANYINHFLELHPSVAISYLYDAMSKKNIAEFRELPFLNRQLHTLRNVQQMKRNVPKHKRGQVTIASSPSFGYITRAEEGIPYTWRFISIKGESYIIVNKPNYRLREGLPISVVVNNDDHTAILSWVYRDEKEMNHDKERQKVREKRRSNVVIEDDVEYLQIGSVSVLLVTAENGVKYRDRLRKHGIKTDWIDPYEKNMKHIKEKSSSYDYVYLFADYMPHAVNQLLDETDESDKFQVFVSENINTVIARTRYLVLQREMEQENELSSNSELKEETPIVE